MISYIGVLRDFLTGFHKRKVAKKEAAKKKAQDRENQERLEARREVCCLLSFETLRCVSQKLHRNEKCWLSKLLRMLSRLRRLTERLSLAKVSCFVAISEFILANEAAAAAT